VAAARIHTPELTPALAWVNTTRPLSLSELRGHVVILDFWTSCCVNCMHVVPILRDLEARHARDPVVVIGVHSAKFAAEQAPARVAEAAARYGVAHPVVVDRGMALWERFGVRSWPTLVIVRPDGTISAVAPGEPDPAVLEAFLRRELDEARAAGTLAAAPASLPLAAGTIVALDEPAATPRVTSAPGTLAYPGKVAVHEDGRIAVADSGHHRVLVLAPTGETLQVIGSGEPGHADGPFARARLDDPQGVAWDDQLLWICDARAHVLARADFFTGQLATLAGTGAMGLTTLGAMPLPARAVALRSPWDVVVDDTRLYVAMAGSHQLAVYDKSRGTIAALAGTGREAIVDGGFAEACFAQPSGLWLEHETLLVADSEVSAVRALDLDRRVVTTIVGGGLFDFGADDGPLARARLQHPLAVASLGGGTIIVADTYNDSLRRLDTNRGVAETLFRGSGAEALHEPSGLALLPSGELLVADTNRHRLARVSRDGRFVGELVITGAPATGAATRERPRALERPLAAVRWFEPAEASTTPLAEGAATLVLTVRAPAGWSLNHQAPVRAQLEVSRRSDLLAPRVSEVASEASGAELTLTVDADVSHLDAPSVPSELLITLDAMLCQDAGGLCAPARGWYRIPVTLAGDGGGHALAATLALAAPEGL
jgi:thiol-disulfide isomerase/thioredoxin/sugar lactone lactonase YvrE